MLHLGSLHVEIRHMNCESWSSRCHRNPVGLDVALNYRAHTEMELNMCLPLLFSFLFKLIFPASGSNTCGAN